MSAMRRGVRGSVVAVVVMAVLSTAMVPLRSHLSVATTALVLVIPVVAGVVVGGLPAGFFAVAAGFLVYDLVFIPPYYTLEVGASQNWIALIVYVAVMLLVASVVARLERTRIDTHQREVAVRRLFELTDLLIEDRPLAEVLELIVSTVHGAFGLHSVALMLPVDTGLELVAAAGEPLSEHEQRAVVPPPGVPASLRAAAAGDHDDFQTVALAATGRPIGLLRIGGPALNPHDQELLRTFANQLALALERAQLREQALRTELLEEVERLQRTLVRAVSHDLRTPLATIKMAASTLHDDSAAVPPAERVELAALIEEQTDRLDRLVTNLLDVSRMESGALELHAEPIAVVDLVHEALGGRQRLAGDVPVATILDSELPLVEVDHLLIAQVLANLLDNAARFAPPGTTVTVSARPSGPGLVAMAIEDRGPGIPKADRAEVFALFARRGSGGGTGVGLSIARAFLAAHGQDIWIEDAPGGGARFCFTLPVAAIASVVP